MQNPYLRLIRFDKPIGTLLLLWPTLWAVFIAGNGHPPVYVVLVFILGVFLTRSSGCAINDYADAEFDKYVARTCNRPLASGAISKKQALVVCFILSLAAFILAYTTLKPATLYMSIPALVIFVTYPFTKRFFAIPQAYLGIAYSFGILMAFIEIQGHLPLISWLIFCANLFWVIGYDTIYAYVDMDDDVKIGIKTSAITFGAYVVPIVFACYLVFAILMAYVAYVFHFGVLFWTLWLYASYLLVYQVFVSQKSLTCHSCEGRNPCYSVKKQNEVSGEDKTRLFTMFLLNNRVGYIIFAAILLGLWKL